MNHEELQKVRDTRVNELNHWYREQADLISVSLELEVTLSILVMKNEAGTPAGDLARAISVFYHNELATQRRRTFTL